MKTFQKFLLLSAAAALFAAGCVNEDPAYLGEEKPAVPSVTHGYLSATALSMRVIADTQTDTGDDDTGGETTRPSSRATDAEPIDTDPFLVEITDAAGVAVLKTTYGELKTQLAEPMPLTVGSYTLTVRSEENAPAAAWEHPVYGASKTFSVSKANTKENPVQIGELVCTLQNVKVTVQLSKDLIDKLTDDSQATVSLGANALVFPVQGGKAGYFVPQGATNTLDFVLQGKFADTQEPVQFSKTISGVKAGQWRRITLVIAYADKGGIHFDIQVDSFIQDETVVVDGTEGAWEAIYEEKPLIDPPTIAWSGHDLAKPFQLKASMFDADNKCTEPFNFQLAAPGRVAAFEVNISSTNADFIEALAVANVPESFDLCRITPAHEAYALLAAFGFPMGDALLGATEKRFDIAGAMPLLYNAPGFDGQHTFAFRIVDTEGQTVQAELVLVVDRTNEGSAADIVWKGNYVDGTPYDIDREEPYELDQRMQIDIEFIAPAGIKKLVVTIISETLDVTEVGLPVTFDLADIQDPALAKTLGAPDPDGFGFPINDKVRDQTYVPFCITPFVKLLPLFEGVHEFKLELTDNDTKDNEVTITKSVKIHVTPAE